MTTNFIEKKGFRFKDDECYSFILLDTPLYKKQLELITEELNEHFSDEGGIGQVVWDDFCEDLQSDGYGNLRFHWKIDVMRWLTDEQLEDINSMIQDAFSNTDFSHQLSMMRCYTQGEVEINSEDDVDDYLETIRECGYKIDWEEEKDVIPSQFHNYVNQLEVKEKLTA